jgi:outer membrane receptor protein involved in Fe transport
VRNTSRLHGAAAPLALAIVLSAQPAFAQDAGTGTSEEPVILVTGSRIASPTIDSVSPVQVIDAGAIDQSGVINIQELLLENPSFGTPALSRTNSNFLTSGTGVATVDLRDLSEERTLVMINSRRVVAGLPGTSIVDLNVIPTQFVERVDILTGGASSLYGSDAVAGVVNFIYKTDFEGLEIEAQNGITHRGDMPTYQANATWGANFSDDRGNVMLHVGYSHEGKLRSRSRANTRIDDLDTAFNISGDPADYGVSYAPYYSGFAPQGRFGAGGYNFTYSPTGVLQPCFNTNEATCVSATPPTATSPGLPDIGTGVGPNGFNRQAYRYIAVPVDRLLFAGRAHYDVTDDVSLFAEATYSNTKASRQLEPYALDTGGATPLYASGLAPIESRVPNVGANTFDIVRNPFVPDAIYNVATDRDGDGLRDITIARRLTDFGPRAASTERNFYRFVAGVEGQLSNDISWDASYTYGRTTESQFGSGQPNFPNLRNALAVIPDANGNPVCADPEAAAAGCIPVHFFGENTVDPAALSYIAADQVLNSTITQHVAQGNLTGSLFELPAGPLGFALGVEYRQEKSREDNDALTNAGLNGSNALPDTEGSFNVKEAYLELNVPILADRPGFYNLALRGAGRISDYSTVGTVYTYSGGIEWAPIQDLRFSGTYARAVRAPNIGELYQGPAQTFPSGLIDPCIGISTTTTGAIAENCRRDPGVAANIAANGVFTLTQSDVQGISGFNSGNPNLREEKADSWTASAVYSPRGIDFLRNTVLRVDYYNIDIDDAIVSVPRTTILQECYTNGNDDYCQFITRYPTQLGSSSAGAIQFINSGGVNAGKLKAEGIDVTLTKRFEFPMLHPSGGLNFRVAYNHQFQNYLIPLEGADKDVTAGEIGSPKDRFTASLGYTSDRVDWGFTGTYLGRSCEDDASLFTSLDLPPCSIKIPAQFYLDTQVGVKFDPAEIFFGIDNLLDNDAPAILSGTPFNTTGTATAADVYDPFGRRYYVGARLRF